MGEKGINPNKAIQHVDTMMTRRIVGTPYKDRNERCRFIANCLGAYMGKSVLNLGGGGEGALKRYLANGVHYCEIDIAGTPDIFLDLEKELPVPFLNNTFSTIVCTDVLEHLDNLHDVFAEIVRVSSKNIIISLPNSVADKSYIFQKAKLSNRNPRRMYHGRLIKYYGLPFAKPADRHKWYFSFSDAADFFEFQAEKHGLTILEIFGVGYWSNKLSKNLVVLLTEKIFGSAISYDLFCHSFWCVLEKQ